MGPFSPRFILIVVIAGAHAALLIIGAGPVWLVFLSAAGIGIAAWAATRPAGRPVGKESSAAERQLSPDHSGVLDEAVLAGLPQPLLVIDHEGRIIRTNKASAALFPQAVPGRLLTAAARNPSFLEAVARVVGSGKPEQVEFAFSSPENRFFTADIIPIRDGAGRPNTLVVCNDVTAAKRIDRVRVDFIANASHELRNPLSSLAGFIETLRGPAKDDPEARSRFLEIMSEQASRMKRLIDDLLSLSRIEIDEHVPPSERVDLVPLLEQVVNGIKPAAEQAGVEIRLTAAPTVSPVVGSTHELSQIFTNLIDNALKYGRAGKVVDVTVKEVADPGGEGETPRRLLVSVKDYGEGIRKEDIPRLTERFYRVDPERSRKEGGTGLGLAIVKHIVNRHKGQLDIQSEPGAGSTFSVLLPAATESSASVPPL